MSSSSQRSRKHHAAEVGEDGENVAHMVVELFVDDIGGWCGGRGVDASDGAIVMDDGTQHRRSWVYKSVPERGATDSTR